MQVGVNQYGCLLEAACDRTIVRDLVDSENYLAYRFNFNTENVEFLPVSRDEIRRVSALKQEYIDANRKFLPVPLAELVPLLESPDRQLADNPPRFIFHTAFCSSTFLSRCLDVEGISFGLREPQILLDAANAKRLQWRSRTTRLSYSDLPKLALLLLRKHAAGKEKLVIKPINSVNNIIPELLQAAGPTRALMLYTDARNFLLSSLRKGEGGRHVTRAMFDLIRCDFEHLASLSLSAMLHMTDLNIILTLWRLQIEQAEGVLRQYAPANTMASLYGENLVRQPQAALEAANRFLELGIPGERIAEIVKSDRRFSDAKSEGKSFSAGQRQETYRKLEEFYGADIDNGLNWMVRRNPGTRLIPALSGALDSS